ncbi:hypothetical protein Q3G72_033275 [Acer saccharum]|nr:hypothetical protein Q3G72_033275 [Acer saccharum]
MWSELVDNQLWIYAYEGINYTWPLGIQAEDHMTINPYEAVGCFHHLLSSVLSVVHHDLQVSQYTTTALQQVHDGSS